MFSHKYRGVHCLSFIIVLIGLSGTSAFTGIPKFEYHQIAKIGSRMGRISLMDVDKDGDLDWIAGCMVSSNRCRKAKAADVDRDGDIGIYCRHWNGNEHVYLRNMLMEHGNN